MNFSKAKLFFKTYTLFTAALVLVAASTAFNSVTYALAYEETGFTATSVTADLVPNLVIRGNTVDVSVAADQYSTRADSDFDVAINSAPLYLGTFRTNEVGNLAFSINIPADFPPGYHTLHIYGPDALGATLDIRDVVYVAASETDYDGDGIVNDKDSCTLIATSNQDVDADSIDDACDPLVDGPSIPYPDQPSINPIADTPLIVVPPLSPIASRLGIITAPIMQLSIIPKPQTTVAGAQLKVEKAANSGVVLGKQKPISTETLATMESKASPEHKASSTLVLLLPGLVALLSMVALVMKQYSKKSKY